MALKVENYNNLSNKCSEEITMNDFCAAFQIIKCNIRNNVNAIDTIPSASEEEDLGLQRLS